MSGDVRIYTLDFLVGRKWKARGKLREVGTERLLKAAELIKMVYRDIEANEIEIGMLERLEALLSGGIPIIAKRKTLTQIILFEDGSQELHLRKQLLLGYECSAWELAFILVHEMTHAHFHGLIEDDGTLESLIEDEVLAYTMEMRFYVKAQDLIGDLEMAQDPQTNIIGDILDHIDLFLEDEELWLEEIRELTLENPYASTLPTRAALLELQGAALLFKIQSAII